MSNQILISSGAKLRDLDDVIIGTDGVLSSLAFNVANGVPKLDENGKILVSQLPNSVMEFKGVWNAATNTPTLANGTGNAGDVYLCNVAGTVDFGAGPIAFAVGDYAVYTGTVWARSSGATGTVTSVGLSRSGDALTVTGSPITTSGTINIGFAGTNLQYINGAGNLVTFPTIATEAQRLITEVYNETGATLAKGTIVYINGGHGNLPTVTKAIATGDATSAQTYGIVQNDIGNMNNGFVVVIGSLTDLDTQVYPEGTQLYLSGTTAGAWTSTKPYAPVHLVYVAIVTRSHPTQGVVEVSIQNGYEMDELHNVSAQNPDNNDILQYKTATSLWTKVAGTTSNIAEGSNLYFTDARARIAISLTTTGSTGAATYDNITGVLNIPNYVDQYVGTVTSVGLSAPTGFSVTGSPVTTTGTLALAFASGYSLPTNVKQSNWDDAYTWVAAFPTQTGNAGKFLTTDGSVLSWATVIAGVQSVTASTPLSSSGGANPNITIQVANTSQNGYLTSTDWNTFNGKQNTITLTTTGTSGAATLIGSTLNIPNYTTDLTGYVTLATTQTITGQKTISRAADAFGGTTQSFLIDGGAGQAAITLNSASTQFAYQTFAQGGVGKFEIGIEGTGGAGNLYINSTVQAGITGASIFVKKSNGFVGILNTNPQVALHVGGNINTTGITSTGRITVNANNNYGLLMNRSAVTDFIGLQYQTAAVNQWYVGLREFSNNNYYIYNETITTNAVTINVSNNNFSINSDITPYLFNVNQAADVWHAAIGNVSATGHMLRIGGAALSGTTKYSTLGAYINNEGNTGTLLVLQRDGGNVIIGGGSIVTDSGELLQVKGGGRFLGSVEINLNQNALTRLNVRNTTAGANAYVETSYQVDSAAGAASLGKYSSTTTAYRFITGSNTYLYNSGAGDISILNDFATGAIKLGAGASNTPHFTIASTGASTFNGAVTIATGVSTPFILTSTTNNQYLYIYSNAEAMTRYENPTAGSWYTGIRTDAGIGSLSSYHIYSSVLAGDAFVLNTNGTGRFASSVTATSFIKTGGTATEYLMADGSISTLTGTFVTIDTAQTITGAKTFSRNASSFGGTTQSLLIDGAGGNGALTINSSVTGYAYQAFAQAGVAKFEIGIVGTGGNGSLYINRNIQSGETGASIFIKKSNGFVGINTIDPPFNFSVYNDSDVWHMSVGGATGQIRFGGQTGSSGGVIQAVSTTGVVRPLAIQRDGGNAIFGGTSDNGYKVQITGGLSVSAGIVASAISLNNNAGGITLNRDSTAYYSTILYQTAGTGRWYIGMRENNGTNDYITFSTTAGDVMRLNQTTGTATFISTVTATGFFDTSDARLKTLVEDNYLLSSIANVKAKLYIKNGQKELGYYAQDLQEILPSAVSEGKDGFLSLSYAQVHTAKIAVIEDEVTILKNRVSELETKLQKYDA